MPKPSLRPSPAPSFYMVRKVGTQLWYDPDRPDWVNPIFATEGKRYVGARGLMNARSAVTFCASTINDHWYPPLPKKAVATEIIGFVEQIRNVGIIGPAFAHHA